mgnify:CR=1 FL=1
MVYLSSNLGCVIHSFAMRSNGSNMHDVVLNIPAARVMTKRYLTRTEDVIVMAFRDNSKSFTCAILCDAYLTV